MADKKRVYGYARSSTDEQDLSIDKQVRRINEYCEKNDYELVKIFSEKVSGRKKIFSKDEDVEKNYFVDLSGRPQLQELKETAHFSDVIEKDFAIICLNPSRLARYGHYQAVLEEMFQDLKMPVEYIEGAASKIQKRLEGLIDEIEVDRTIKRTKDALQEKKERDEWVGRPPTGYEVNDNGKLVEQRPLFDALAQAESFCKAGGSYAESAEYGSKAYEDIEITKSQVRSFVNRDKQKIRRFLE